MPELRSDVVKKLLISVALLPGVLAGATSSHAGVLTPAGLAAGGGGLTSFYVTGFELGPWQDYLARELTPTYLLPDNAAPLHISWLHSDQVMILPDFGQTLLNTSGINFRMDVEWQSSSEFIRPDFDTVTPSYQGTSFERQYFAPGMEHDIGEGGILGVSAVIAYQRYSAAGLGLWAAQTPDQHLFATPRYAPYAEETGYGTGVRLDVRQEVGESVTFDAGFQSRIDMEEFANYHGVYANPADLDIPARAYVGMAFQASSHSWLNVAVERVMYSDINAFPSRYLPNRFLSLLGDSSSPEFNWNDLTVYSVGWAWSDGRDQQWRFDLKTRTQPSPSSSLLNQALSDDLADSAMTFGYSRRTGIMSRLHFNAAWAPSEFAFGGSVLGVTTDNLDQDLEVEALWTLDF
jgi:long-chain fatty acid transport protein